jgi:hypothetical protein
MIECDKTIATNGDDEETVGGHTAERKAFDRILKKPLS